MLFWYLIETPAAFVGFTNVDVNTHPGSLKAFFSVEDVSCKLYKVTGYAKWQHLQRLLITRLVRVFHGTYPDGHKIVAFCPLCLISFRNIYLFVQPALPFSVILHHKDSFDLNSAAHAVFPRKHTLEKPTNCLEGQ